MVDTPTKDKASTGQSLDDELVPRLSFEDVNEDPALNDISRTLHGAKAITGKGAFSAMSGNDAADKDRRDRDQRQQVAKTKEQEELEALAEWGQQMTVVGGVAMTNEEAQEARQRFIDNEDFYTQRAVERGDISQDDAEDLKRGMRRQRELKEREGRGILTAAERREMQEWERSRLGQIGDRIIGEIHQGQSFKQDLAVQGNGGKALQSSHADQLNDNDLFQSAPQLGAAFSTAHDNTKPGSLTAPPPVSRELKAMGLDL